MAPSTDESRAPGTAPAVPRHAPASGAASCRDAANAANVCRTPAPKRRTRDTEMAPRTRRGSPPYPRESENAGGDSARPNAEPPRTLARGARFPEAARRTWCSSCAESTACHSPHCTSLRRTDRQLRLWPLVASVSRPATSPRFVPSPAPAEKAPESGGLAEHRRPCPARPWKTGRPVSHSYRSRGDKLTREDSRRRSAHTQTWLVSSTLRSLIRSLTTHSCTQPPTQKPEAPTKKAPGGCEPAGG